MVILKVEGFPRSVPVVEEDVTHGVFSFLVSVFSLCVLGLSLAGMVV